MSGHSRSTSHSMRPRAFIRITASMIAILSQVSHNTWCNFRKVADLHLSDSRNGIAASGKISYDVLKYIFCDIIQNGYIFNIWVSFICAAVLSIMTTFDLLDEIQQFRFIEGNNMTFKSPTQILRFEKYVKYIKPVMPLKNLLAFWIHSNADIDMIILLENMHNWEIKLLPNQANLSH